MGGIPLAVRWYSRRLGGGFRKGWADVARLGRLTDGVCILRVKLLFLLRESGMFLSYSWFFAYPAGAKTAFSFDSKEKAVLDSEKEKIDQWKSWGGAVQQDRGPILLGCSSGKILWDILLFSAACV